MAFFGRKSRAPRRSTNQEAWVAIDGTFAARRCSVLDISGGGAKIKIDDPTFVSPVFQLKFSRADRGRRCKVSWRKGLVIGVEFC
jgi:PilZ domain-containing protein